MYLKCVTQAVLLRIGLMGLANHLTVAPQSTVHMAHCAVTRS